MRFYDFSPERTAEYMRRINRVIKAHPYDRYPSQFDRDFLCYAMRLNLTSTSMNMASRLGDTKLCEKIYSEKSNTINAKDNKGNTPLMNAVQRKRLGTAEWLLQHGAKILPNKAGWNPVLLACWQGCIPALNMFKHYGMDFTQPYKHLEWKGSIPRQRLIFPIEIAVLSNQAKAVEWLFNNGVSVNDKMEKGYSVRQMLAAKPEYFTQEIKEIVMKKMFDESQEAIQDIQKIPQKRSFWQRISFGRIKE